MSDPINNYVHSPTVRSMGYPARWYVTRNIDGRQFSAQYLHRDGVWRPSTQDTETGEFTGYYANEAEARQVLRQFGGGS